MNGEGAPRGPQQTAAKQVTSTVSRPADNRWSGAPTRTDSAGYRTSAVKRVRRTKEQLGQLDAAIVTAVATETPVTVRGVFYRVVSAGAVEKTEKGYSAVQRRLLDLRRTRIVPYSSITDGTRLRLKPDSWGGLDQMLADAASSYRRALWNDQDVEVIVVCEKDAISGVVYPVTAEFDVELCITRGYSSETFTHSIAQTVDDNTFRGKATFLYQLGDHDPSGVDAWREFSQKVRGFVPCSNVTFERIAVTPQQIALWNLPTRPTKTSDSRAAKFLGESVEVDAVPATQLRALLRTAIEQHIDAEALRITRIAEDSERNILCQIAGAT